MARNILRFALAASAALALACDSDPSRAPLAESTSTLPVGIENGLFFAGNTSEPRAVTIDVEGPARVNEHELSSPPAVSLPRTLGGSSVVVMTAGIEAKNHDGKRDAAVSSELAVFDRNHSILAQPYRLKTRFSKLVLSEDGRFALAHGPVGVGLQNAVEVIDLNKVEGAAGVAADGASTLVYFSFNGIAPSTFVFSPAGSTKRRLVVVPFPDSVQLLDLENTSAGPISIPLKTPDDSRTLVPGNILFAGERIFVQASNASQVFAIALLDAPNNKHGFEPNFSVLTTNSAVTQIALAGTGADQRLLALAGRLDVFDPSSGGSFAIEGVRGFGAVLPFSGTSPVDPNNVSSRALVYSPQQSKVGFVDLAGGSNWTTRSIETLELGAPISALLPLKASKLALALHSSNKLSIIDLQARTVRPLTLDGALASYLVDETSDRTRLWMLTPSTLAVHDLADLTTTEVPLAVSVGWYGVGGEDDFERSEGVAPRSGQLVLVPGVRRRIAVVHASSAGRITLLDANDPTLQSSWLELTGFSLAGLFD